MTAPKNIHLAPLSLAEQMTALFGREQARHLMETQPEAKWPQFMADERDNRAEAAAYHAAYPVPYRTCYVDEPANIYSEN